MPNAATVSPARIAPALYVLGGLGTVLLAVGITLWAYFGTTAFFEMLASGLAYCF